LPYTPSTFFASGVRAAATLPGELRAQVETRTATHALAYFVTGDEGARSRHHALDENVPRHEHPILRRHPRTGEMVLFVTDLHVERINDLGDPESRELIDAILAHLYSPANVYEHRWVLGDLIVWDNEALQHSRPDVTLAKPRTFRRNSLNTARWTEMVGSYLP
jgi:taurine dioxygenase